MNHKLFLAATLGLLSLSACRPRTDIEFNDVPFASKDAVFLSEVAVTDLDQDGDSDDSITSLSLLIRKDLKSGVKKDDLCDVVSQINAAQGDLGAASGDDLIFISAVQLHLNQTNVPFVEGDSLTGGDLTDTDGLSIDGASQVTSFLKSNNASFNILSVGFGTLDLEKLSDNSLNTNFIDAPSIVISKDFNSDNVVFNEVDFSLEGSIKRAEPCASLSTFVPKLVGQP